MSPVRLPRRPWRVRFALMISRPPASDSASPIQNDARGRRRSTSHDMIPTKIGVLLPRMEATAACVLQHGGVPQAPDPARKTRRPQPRSRPRRGLRRGAVRRAKTAPRQQHRAGDQDAVERGRRSRHLRPPHEDRRPRDPRDRQPPARRRRAGWIAIPSTDAPDHQIGCDDNRQSERGFRFTDPWIRDPRLPAIPDPWLRALRPSACPTSAAAAPSSCARPASPSAAASPPRPRARAADRGRRSRPSASSRRRCPAPTPSFSTAHLPSRVKKPPRGAIIDPPSMNAGVSAVCTRPPHVRLPTSGPILRRLNMYGIRSPPEPAISLMIITFGPQMPADGLVNGIAIAGDVVEVAVEVALQHVDDVVGRRAAAVVALVDDRALLVLLREVVAVEARVAALPGVRHVDVGELAVRQLVDQCGGCASTHARVRSACSLATGTTVTCRAPSIAGLLFTVSTRLPVRRAVEQPVDVVGRAQLDAVDREDVVADR